MTNTTSSPLLSVRDLSVQFRLPAVSGLPWSAPRTLQAVDAVSLDVAAGETLGIVGESGCGKSTLARALLNMVPCRGSVRWQGQEMVGASNAQWLRMRRQVQMVFQDPLASLDPRMTIGQIIAEPLRTHSPELSRKDTADKVASIMERVGLDARMINRYPHEFSGGQCQRIGIARALVLEPKLVICDEPVSALDVSIQAQIINLLRSLQDQMGLALLFIAHDLAVVRHISHRVLVMYFGRSMETGSTDALYLQASHPYTRALLSAVPLPDPTLARQPRSLLQGDLPSPLAPPSGCSFRTRCPLASERCSTERPLLRLLQNGSSMACHRD